MQTYVFQSTALFIYSYMQFVSIFRTDQLIQQTIREKFTDHTVVTNAHCLNTINESLDDVKYDSLYKTIISNTEKWDLGFP